MNKAIRIILFIFLVSFLGMPIFSNETIDKSKIPRLKWMGPGSPGTYEDYISAFPGGRLYLNEIKIHHSLTNAGNTEMPKILIFVNTLVYSNASQKIMRYVGVLEDLGYWVKLYTTFGGTPEAVKSIMWLLTDTVKSAPPVGLGYNLFCCSSLRYTDYNYLGGGYVFNSGEKALTVIGVGEGIGYEF